MSASPDTRCDAAARELAAFLAAHVNDGAAFAPAKLAELDRCDGFPAAACSALDNFGLADFYVPREQGGRWDACDQLMHLWRAVARHDLSVVIAHGKTFLGSICGWLAGSAAQRAQLAEAVRAGTPVSWGLTERHHGGDLLAGELSAVKDGTGWRIDGEKWLINNATRGGLIVVLARTGAAGDARGFSLFLVDKARLPEGAWRTLPKVRTLGIRGADISGIAFHDAQVPDDALIGTPGEGIEIVLKALQVTRALCSGLSLGAADHGLWLAASFMAERALYGHRLLDLPLARHRLGEALAMHFAAEVVGQVACRSIDCLREEMSVTSAIAKAFVPSTVERLLGKLADMLGARAYLDDVHADGAFQKLERDHRIVPIFDGSTVVNRQALINQFPLLARASRRGAGEPAALAGAFALHPTAGAGTAAPFSLISNGGSSVVQSLDGALARLRELADTGAVTVALAAAARSFGAWAGTVQAELLAYRPALREVPAQAFDLARRYELCYAGAACIGFWLAHRDGERAGLLADPAWLQAVLAWILDEARQHGACDADAAYAAIAGLVLDSVASWQHAGVSLLSLTTGER
jgi:alkylation response protein AidB-like acyl-CoA dehydrogenase